jgi:filamentous hemagglutinin
LTDKAGEYLRDDQGRVQFIGTDGQGNLGDFLEKRPDLRSTMGGWQGSLGKFVFFDDYLPGSFGDRVSEAWAGPHDMLNSFIWYDKMGSIQPGIEGTALGAVGDVMNYVNVLAAAPFAFATLTPPELLILMQNRKKTETK